MLIPKVEFLDDIQATDDYQKQLKALYLTVSDNQHQTLTVLIDLNIYGTAVFDLLDCGIDLPFERIKRIHHSFSDDFYGDGFARSSRITNCFCGIDYIN